MAEDRWDKVGKLFEEVREKPPEKRAAYLAEVCDEESLRTEVLSLLKAEAQVGGFFEDLASVLPTAADAEVPEDRQIQELRTPDPLDLEGETVGRYAVEEHLGGGGMGVVYRAHDPELDRWVALKFLPPSLAASREGEERFVREARAASALEHPHIATIYEIGTSEAGHRFIAMAYYEGETLKEKLAREAPLSVEEAIRYAEQISAALTQAHEAGIVHRDVKPANVMVTETGTVKLLDFGLAKAAADTRLTQPGRQLGTAAYMSPEQAKGEPVGPPSDLWAVGVVLYEMVTGTRPFRGGSMPAVLRAILDDDPTPLHELRDDVPPRISHLVGRCLEKNPDDRPASAEVLLEELQALRTGSAPSYDSAPQRTQAPILGSASSLALLILLVVGIAGLTWAGWNLWLGPPSGPLAGDSAGPDPQEVAQPEDPGVQALDLEPTTVAVLYFADNSPGDTLTAFADGFTEHLNHRLTQVEGLNVISRHGVEPYREAMPRLDSIAQRLRAGSLITGSVRPVAGSLAVHVQLIDGETQSHLMSEVIRRPTTEVFALQNDLAREASRLLRKRLGREVQLASWQAETQSVEAWRLVERADRLREDATQLEREDQPEAALELAAQADSLLAEAGAIDPEWSAPPALRARLATVQVDPYASSWGERERSIVRQRIGYANEALRRNPGDTEARTTRGQLRYWLSKHLDDPERTQALVDQAEQDLRRTIRKSPGAARAMSTLSRLLLESRGDFEQASYYAQRAQKADAYLRIPADTRHQMFYAALNAGDFETAAHQCYIGQERYPELVEFRNCELALLATEGAVEPDVARAWALVEEIRVRTAPEKRAFYESLSHPKVAAVLARAGQSDSARAVLRQTRVADPQPPVTYFRAHAYLLLGEKEQALNLLSRAVKQQPQYGAVAAKDPWFESLRDHPRFHRIVHQ